jgi:hypothetical protein
MSMPWENHVIPEKSGPKSVRSCRLDMRLTKGEKVKLERKARIEKRTVTSIISELIENME